MAERRETTVSLKRGEVLVRDQVTPDELCALELDPGIGKFSGYKSILSSLDGLMVQAREKDTNLCLAIHGARQVVGYAVLRRPPRDERWAEMEPPVLFELFGENARGWRSRGLMRPMLEILVDRPENDERIIYIVGYSWHWDLDETKKDLMAYRDTIIHLLTPLGFKQYPTNEPNVCLRPENLFMARIGEKVERPVKRKFTNLLFGIGDD